MSVNHCLPVLVFYFTHPAARSLCDSWASCFSNLLKEQSNLHSPWVSKWYPCYPPINANPLTQVRHFLAIVLEICEDAGFRDPWTTAQLVNSYIRRWFFVLFSMPRPTIVSIEPSVSELSFRPSVLRPLFHFAWTFVPTAKFHHWNPSTRYKDNVSRETC